ncbi:hypothetical protein Q8F55_004281 [Vanrija albida]|uniref:Uncharacterized protein n=1 Tax=Vanrija albida TaxID=181172 RepID=A0ABR3Q6A6_9TREE
MPSPPRSPRESGELRESRGGHYSDTRPSALPPRPRSPVGRRSASPPTYDRSRYNGSAYRDPRRDPDRSARPSDPRRWRDDQPDAGPSRPGREVVRENTWPKPSSNSLGYYSPPTGPAGRRDSSPPPKPVTTDEFTDSIFRFVTARSRHGIAVRNLDRLKEFNADAPTLRDAQNQVDDLTNEVRFANEAVGAGFNDLLRRALARPGVREGDTAVLEIEGLRQRVLQLEQSPAPLRIGAAPPSATPPPPPPSQEPPPPPSGEPPSSQTPEVAPPLDKGKGREQGTPAGAESTPKPAESAAAGADGKNKSVDGKRDRARALLLDLVAQVNSVKARVDDLDEKYDELENEINVQDYDKAHRVRSWEQYQRRNDPNGRLTGKPRPAVATKDEETPSAAASIVAQAAGADKSSTAAEPDPSTLAVVPAQAGPSTTAVVPAPANAVAPPAPAAAPVDHSDGIRLLAAEMVRMQEEIRQLRANEAIQQEEIRQLRDSDAVQKAANIAASQYTTAAAAVIKSEVDKSFSGLKQEVTQEFIKLRTEVVKEVRSRVDTLVTLGITDSFTEMRPFLRQDVYKDVCDYIKASMRDTAQGQA